MEHFLDLGTISVCPGEGGDLCVLDLTMEAAIPYDRVGDNM